MSATNLQENNTLKHFLGISTIAFEAAIYVGLLTVITDAEIPTITEATYTGYARQTVTFENDADGHAQNTGAVTFPENTGSSQTMVGFALYVAVSGGTARFVNVLTGGNISVENGDTPNFAINALEVTAS